jgi:hypothetical protein
MLLQPATERLEVSGIFCCYHLLMNRRNLLTASASAASVNNPQFATTPNAGPYMEYVWRAPPQKKSWFTPGLGLEFDPDFLKKAAVVKPA